MKKKTNLLSILILIQLIIVFLLFFKIQKKRNNVLDNLSINPIKRENLSQDTTQESSLRFFYQFKPNTIIKDFPLWLKKSINNTINADGLNERFDYSIIKNRGVFRIITLGDSFTFGAFVNTPDNYSEQLEDLLNKNLSCKNINKFEVINLGVGGYDIEYAVERYRIKGQKYNPDLVLWFLKDDDFQIINEYVIPLEKQLQITMKLNPDSKEYYYSKDGTTYPTWVKSSQKLLEEKGGNYISNYNYNALNKINLYFKNPLLIFTYPPTQEMFRSLMLKFSVSRKNTFFNDKLFNIYQNNENFYFDKHPNQKGHELIANDLFNYLINNRLVFCNKN